jgi:hypothetical protein
MEDWREVAKQPEPKDQWLILQADQDLKKQ